MPLPSGRRTARSKEIHAATASISRTHSQCQRGTEAPIGAEALISCLHTWKIGAAALLRSSGFGGWWSQTGSNRRPQACKASALPTELWPLLRSPDGELRRASPLGSCERPACQAKLREERSLVGRVGVEPTTSRLSGVRSNHLSYRPPPSPRLRRAGPISRQAALPPKPARATTDFPG